MCERERERVCVCVCVCVCVRESVFYTGMYPSVVNKYICFIWVGECPTCFAGAGQVSVQLELLEGKSEVYASLELLDERGRKPVGGKMEVYVRLREPLTGKGLSVPM